jgi:hypothetical protein
MQKTEKSAEQLKKEAGERRTGARLKAQSMARTRAAARRDLAQAETRKLQITQLKDKKKRYGTPGALKLDALTDHEREVVLRYNENKKKIDAEKKKLQSDMKRRRREGVGKANQSNAPRGKPFLPKNVFAGNRPGYVFKTGSKGLGYYLDHGGMSQNQTKSPNRPTAAPVSTSSLFQWRDPTKNAKQTFATDIISKKGGHAGRVVPGADEVEVSFVTDPDGTVRMITTSDPEFAALVDPD